MYKLRACGLWLLVLAFIFAQTPPSMAQEQVQSQGEVDTAGNRIGAPAQEAPATPEEPVQAAQDDIKILCYTSQTGPPDPCIRVAALFSDVTTVRSAANIPSDLSPFDVFYLGYGEGNTLASLASTFVDYVDNGGGFIVSQPNLTGAVSVYPPGFEMTVTDNAWPGFPSVPGPVEFTASGAVHPILNGLGPNDISGNFETVPLNLTGPGWTVLIKSVAHPHVALAVGNYGDGRLAFHSGNISAASVDQGSDAYVRQLIEWAGASDEPGPDMRIDAIEVTQAIQDLNNSVELVANKRTYVRVHVSSPENEPNVFANLSGAHGGTTLFPTLSPGNPGADITVRTSPNRGLINDSYWFELPNSWTTAGNLTLTARLDPADAKNDPNRTNNTKSVTVNFIATPPLRLRLINVRYTAGGTTYLAANNHLNNLESWLRRAYPINSLQVARQTFDYPAAGLPNVDTLHGWLALGKILRILFMGEDPRVVYYGIVDDGGGFMRGKALDIPSTIAAGPTGPGTFGWDTDGSYGDWYGGHEIAHTRNRYHAEFCGAAAGQPYPYSNGRISQNLTGATALFGFDVETRAIYDPSTWRDVMTYCSNQWISDFTYEGIRSYLASLGAAAVEPAATLVQADQFLVVMGMADLETNTAALESVYLLNESQDVPLPEPGDWTLALQNAAGDDLETYAFAPMELTDSEEAEGRPAVIALLVPAVDGLARLEIRYQNEVVAARSASAHPPVVEITSPVPGPEMARTEETLNVTWEASDPDGDPLSFSLLYSNNNGQSWQTLATGLTGEAYGISTDLLPGGSSSLVRVLVSDGFLGAEATSEPFSVPLHAPEVTIASPAASAVFWPGQNVVLQGSAYDLEDGTLEGAALVWQSNIDGVLGTGTLANTVSLSTGQHTISLTATDSDAMQGVAQTQITILAGDAAEPTLLDYNPNALSHVVFKGGAAATFDVALNSSDDSGLNWQASADQAWITLNMQAGTVPSQFQVTLNPAGLDAGSYEGMVTLQAAGAANSPVKIPVVLQVIEPPTLLYTPTSLSYSVVVDGAAAMFDIDLNSSDDSGLDWQASADQAWITLNAPSGTTPSQLQVTLDPAGLDAGSYEGTISITAPTASNSPVEIPVTLTVEARAIYLPFLSDDE